MTPELRRKYARLKFRFASQAKCRLHHWQASAREIKSVLYRPLVAFLMVFDSRKGKPSSWTSNEPLTWFIFQLQLRGLRHASALFLSKLAARHASKPGVLWRLARVWKAVRP